MHWRRFLFGTMTGAAAAAATFGAVAPARATGDAAGTLGAGGTAKGDVSTAAGETDRVAADLVAGSALDVVFTASFAPTLVVTDPDGGTLDLGFPDGAHKFRVHGLTVPASGAYEFAVASLDGSQGTYSLTVKPAWAKSIPVSGTGRVVLDVPMPAGAKASATLVRAKGAAVAPRIEAFSDPDGTNLLAAPVEPRGSAVRLPATTTSAAGVHTLTVAPSDGVSAWTGRVTRSVPKAKPTALDLRNELDVVSFTADGIDQVFRRRCQSCHGWAGSYAGVRSLARDALGRMRSGSMPPDGRVPADEVSLVASWIATGRAR